MCSQELYFCQNCSRQHCLNPIIVNTSKISSRSKRGITTTIHKDPLSSYKRKNNLDLQLINNISDKSIQNKSQKEFQDINNALIQSEYVDKIVQKMKLSLFQLQNQISNNTYQQNLIEKQQSSSKYNSNRNYSSQKATKEQDANFFYKSLNFYEPNVLKQLNNFDNFKNQFAYISQIKEQKNSYKSIIKLKSKSKIKIKPK